ncbi:rhodanese-like domain-containing protein [Desulfuromonas acetoxidans]|uniref:sulfurtransferase n=1 Tax=Desulfuromonas acetoxidans TaxID=891 RepID=UPI00292EB90C|nr:rhodanese-like domain-containing protein [Desulfuromonas acetoxidans]
MQKPFRVRLATITLVLLLGVWWALASAATGQKAFPNGQYLLTASELMQRQKKEPLVIVDVRTDEDFDGKVIPGAIRLPWSAFRSEDPARNMEGLFVGPAQAQQILGEHGLFRNDMIVLYDSVASDGGATASYIFWVLDMLGHKKMAILERGIDGWLAAGGKVVNKPQKREPLLYQAPTDEINLRRKVDEQFILPRLGDPYYQILDVRSSGEYLGKTLNTGLNGDPLKAGHIPGAFNINYENNWADAERKTLKSYADLAKMYQGLNPTAGVIAYCHSARRSSFSYFVLRLLGFKDVLLYDNSWFGWGGQERYYPAETTVNLLRGQAPPQVEQTAKADTKGQQPPAQNKTSQGPASGSQKKGYISCGG